MVPSAARAPVTTASSRGGARPTVADQLTPTPPEFGDSTGARATVGGARGVDWPLLRGLDARAATAAVRALDGRTAPGAPAEVGLYDPVWVEGRLRVGRVTSAYGDAGYAMDEARVTPYARAGG